LFDFVRELLECVLEREERERERGEKEKRREEKRHTHTQKGMKLCAVVLILLSS